jgi:hypothetical protein
MFSMTKNKLGLYVRLKNLARRGFGCIACQDRRTACIFAEDGTLKHPQEINRTGEELCTTCSEECALFSQNSVGVTKDIGGTENRNIVEDYFDLFNKIIEESAIQKFTETVQHG